MIITPYKIKKAYLYLKHFGPKEFWNHLLDRLEPEDVPYDSWYRNHAPKEPELERQKKSGKDRKDDAIKFSIIVPAYCTPEKFLREMIASVTAQTYGNWELCIADASDRAPGPGMRSVEEIVRSLSEEDDRIRYAKLAKNRGISENTNAAFDMVSGDYICFLDHDDLLAPHALYLYSEEIEKYIIKKCVYVKKGQKVNYFSNSSDALGIVFFRFPNKETMYHYLNNIYEYIWIELA